MFMFVAGLSRLAARPRGAMRSATGGKGGSGARRADGRWGSSVQAVRGRVRQLEFTVVVEQLRRRIVGRRRRVRTVVKNAQCRCCERACALLGLFLFARPAREWIATQEVLQDHRRRRRSSCHVRPAVAGERQPLHRCRHEGRRALRFDHVGFNSFGSTAVNVVVAKPASWCRAWRRAPASARRISIAKSALGHHFRPTLIDVKDAVGRHREVLRGGGVLAAVSAVLGSPGQARTRITATARAAKDATEEPPRPEELLANRPTTRNTSPAAR